MWWIADHNHSYFPWQWNMEVNLVTRETNVREEWCANAANVSVQTAKIWRWQMMAGFAWGKENVYWDNLVTHTQTYASIQQVRYYSYFVKHFILVGLCCSENCISLLVWLQSMHFFRSIGHFLCRFIFSVNVSIILHYMYSYRVWRTNGRVHRWYL